MIKKKQLKILYDGLDKHGIVTLACLKSGIGHATYYRWSKDNPDLATEAEEHRLVGVSAMNDAAKASLLALIKDKNLGAVKYHLSHKDEEYKQKKDVSVLFVHEKRGDPMPKIETRTLEDLFDEAMRDREKQEAVGIIRKEDEEFDLDKPSEAPPQS